jgi:hypothetical protein
MAGRIPLLERFGSMSLPANLFVFKSISRADTNFFSSKLDQAAQFAGIVHRPGLVTKVPE